MTIQSKTAIILETYNMNKTISLNTNLIPIFQGTYNTIWEVTEYNEEGTDEVMVDYEHKDFMQSIVEAYKDNEKYILSELNCPFIKELHFTGDFHSPREYNFSTDELDFNIVIDEDELNKTVKTLKNDEQFSQFLKDNYTSYDGFWSFTPNKYDEVVYNLHASYYYEQAISAIITYFARENIRPHGGVSIEEMVYDDWQGNGYYGLDYQVVPEEATA